MIPAHHREFAGWRGFMKTVLFCLLIASTFALLARPARTMNSEAHVPQAPPTLVIGFVGGFISHDNPAHGGVQLAARLRKDYPGGVYARVFENHRGEEAYNDILRLLDTNHD